MIGDARLNARAAGLLSAAAAVGLGIGYMVAADAPPRYAMVNGAALAIGLLLFAGIAPFAGRMRGGAVTIAIGFALMATALFGVSAEGAARWVSLGPILLQPSLILLPMLVVALARAHGPAATAGVILAAAALALQPDRAMAGALAASLLTLVLIRRDRWSQASLIAAAAGFAVTLLRPDALPAAPYVDGVFYSAFDVHLLAGLAVVAGAGLLLAPAIVGFGRGDRDASLLFGTVWLAVIAAAALGNYPTPLVGYGGSAVIGYLLSLSLLPRAARAAAAPVAEQDAGLAEETDRATLAASLS